MTLEVFGEVQLSRELLRVGANAANMRPAFDEIHEDLLDAEQQQFSSQGARFSGGWRPLAASTVAAKARAGQDPRILHRTLRLRNSLTQAGHPDHVYDVGADEMFTGSRVSYGVYHQHGDEPRMPRRRPFELDAATRRDIMKVLQRHLLGS